MKNAINYYYNLEPDNIHQKEDTYYFDFKNSKYMLIPTNRSVQELKDLYYLSSFLISNNIFVDQIILNINNEYVTRINEKNFILFNMLVNDKSNISFDDILFFSNILIGNQFNNIKRDNWYNLWTNKIDYFEYQVSEVGIKYPYIRMSFSYYVGMAENAIMLINGINNNNLVVSHRRIKNNYTMNDLYNPLNLVLDNKVRDITEYLKEKFFFNEEETYNETMKYINLNLLNNDDAIMFLARLIYPSYYFDIYEKIMDDKVEDKSINNIIVKVEDYEHYIKEVYSVLRKKYSIPIIGWLEKKRIN